MSGDGRGQKHRGHERPHVSFLRAFCTPCILPAQRSLPSTWPLPSTQHPRRRGRGLVRQRARHHRQAVIEGEFLPHLGPRRGRRLQGVAQRPLVLQPARRTQPGALLHVEAERPARRQAAGGRHRGLRAGQARHLRGKGEFQLVVTRMLPTAAIGAAQQELERVKARSSRTVSSIRRGSARSRAMPAPSRSSPASPARRCATSSPSPGSAGPAPGSWWSDARVQGDGAVEELCRALRLVNRLPGLDLCIVGRGGGGREDLAAFNSEAVCRALADVRVPTISAVGHETDISLTDLVADLRAADAVRRGGAGLGRPARRGAAARRSRGAARRRAQRPHPSRRRAARAHRRPAARRNRGASRAPRHRSTGSPPSSTR